MSQEQISKSELSQAIAKIFGSLLHGVAEATLKCIDYDNCIVPQGQGQMQGQMQGPMQVGGIIQKSVNRLGPGPANGLGPAPENTLATTADTTVITVEDIEKALGFILKIIGKFVDSIAPVIEELFLGDLENQDWSDVAPKIAKLINDNKYYLEKFSTDPVLQEALREWAEAYAIVSIQTIEAVKPYIDLMVDEALQTLGSAAKKAGSGITNTIMNFVEAAVGEIPVAGGIIDIIIAIIRGFNSIMIASAPLYKNGIQTIGSTYNTYNKVSDIIRRGQETINRTSQKLQSLASGIEEFKSGIQDVKTGLQNVTSGVQNVTSGVQNVTSGVQNVTSGVQNVTSLGKNTVSGLQNIGKNIGTTAVANLQEAVQRKAQGAVQGAVQRVVPRAAVPGAALPGAAVPRAAVPRAALPRAALPRAAVPRVQTIPTRQFGGLRKKINKTAKRIKKTLYNFRLVHSKKHGHKVKK